MTGPHPDAPDNIRQISVEPQLLDNEKRSLGGTRGKNEYRRHIGVESIIGRHGSTTYFRGTCCNCNHEMICHRLEKRKNLAKCPECDETSFIYKGFFSLDDCPFDEREPPKSDECCEDIYIMLLENDGKYSKPTLLYGTKNRYDEVMESDSYWDHVELLEVIETDN